MKKLFLLSILLSCFSAVAQNFSGGGGGLKANVIYANAGDNITNKINSLTSNSKLIIGPGVFTIVPQITTNLDSPRANALVEAKNNWSIEGNNTIINGVGPGDFFAIKNCTNWNVSGIIFTNNRPGVTQELYSVINLYGTNDLFKITDCTFTGFGNHGISHPHNWNSLSRGFIHRNIFEYGGQLGLTNDSDGAAISAIGRQWDVGFNYFRGVIRAVEVEGTGPFVAQGVSIHHNHFDACVERGVMVWPSHGDSTRMIDISITDNTFTNGYNTAGPGTNAAVNGYADIDVRGGERIIVSRNQMTKARGTASSGPTPISMTGSDSKLLDFIVSENTIYDTENEGIKVSGLATNGLIVNNVVRAAATTGNGFGGIVVYDGTRIKVSGNMVRDLSAGGLGLNAIRVVNGLDCIVNDNVSVDTRSGGSISTKSVLYIDATATRTEYYNNKAYNCITNNVLDFGIYSSYPDGTKHLTATRTTSSTSVSNVVDLSFTLLPYETRTFEFNLYTTSDALGAKYAIDIPSGASFTATAFGNTSAAATFGSDTMTADSTLGATFNTAATSCILRITGTVRNGATIGTVQLQQAKVTSGVCSVLLDSYVSSQRFF